MLTGMSTQPSLPLGPTLSFEKRTECLMRLHELTIELMNVERIGTLLQRIVESVVELFAFERASISVRDSIRGVFTDHALAGYTKEEEREIRESESAFAIDAILADFKEEFKVSNTAFFIPAERQTSPLESFVAVKDKNGAKRPRASPDAWHELDLLYFALHDRRGEMIGYLQVDYPKNGKLPSMDVVAEIELFAGIAAVGIENAKIYEKTHALLKENEAKTESITKLLDLTRSVLKIDNTDVVLQKISDAMASAFGYRKAGVSLFSDDSNEVTIHALTGYTAKEEAILRNSTILKDKVLEDFREEFRVTTNGYFIPAESQKGGGESFVFMEDPSKAEVPRATPDTWHELDLLYFSILDRNGKMLGYIQLDYPIDERIPSKETMEIMEAYAGIASIAIENSRMFAETNEARKQAKMYLDLVTHDIGNLVNPVAAYIELVLGTTHLTPVQSKYLSSALEATRSMSHLIRNVRRSSQMLEATQVEIVPKDLKRSINQVASDVRNVFLSRKVTIRMNMPEEDVWVMADDLLDEIFYNLLSNSIKYDEHEEVVIDVIVDVIRFENQDYARVRIADRGIGIPDDLKNRVFQKGFRDMHRQERPSLHKVKGAGMGLYLVKSLVDRYRGRVWVENRVYADHTMGSVFIVLLPVP